ncbi:MAG: hypothetical protein GY772_18155 [bacterium]|nr:hypothetical protein [bacterium]
MATGRCERVAGGGSSSPLTGGPGPRHTASEPGQGRDHGGGEETRKNRADPLDRVPKPDQARPAAAEADRRRRQRRPDAAGAREYKGARGSHPRNTMRNPPGEPQRGDQRARPRRQARTTRHRAPQPEPVVPGAPPLPLADGAGAAASEAAPS